MVLRESNALHLEVLEVAPSVGVPMEVDIYDGSSPGTMLAHLEGAEQVKFSYTLNEPGAGSFRISRGDPKATAAIIDRENIARIKMGGVYRFEFAMEEREVETLSPDEGGGEFWTIGGREAVHAYLDRARMSFASNIPGSAPVEGVWNFTLFSTGNKLGQMLLRSIEEHRTKIPPTFEFLVTDFTYGVDSHGEIWAKDADVQVNVGTSELDVWKLLTGLGLESRSRPGYRLQAFEHLGRHFEADGGTGEVIFRAGQNVTTALKKRAQSGVRSDMYVKGSGDQWFHVVRPDLRADPIIRRREGFLSFSNSTDPTTVQRAAEAELAALEAGGNTPTFGVDHDVSRGGYEPFVHYDVGDWATLDEPGVYDMETIRIVGISVEQEEDDYRVVVDANSIAYEALIRLARRMQNGGGSFGSGSSSSNVGAGGGGGGGIASPSKVAVEAGDTPGYLYSKLLEGDGIDITLDGAAGNRRARIAAAPAAPIALDAISDVDLTGALTGHVLTRRADGIWIAQAPAAGGGGGAGYGERNAPEGTLLRTYDFQATLHGFVPNAGTLTRTEVGAGSGDWRARFAPAGESRAIEPAGTPNVADGEVTLDLWYITNADDSGRVWIRAADINNGYMFTIRRNEATLYRAVGGGFASLGSIDKRVLSGFSADRRARLPVLVRFEGPAISLYLFGAWQLTWIDTTYTTGRIGIGAWGATCDFDDVKVYQL